MPENRPRRTFWAAFFVLSGLAALPVWSVDYLPLVDVPQHEALVSVLSHWNDPDCGYSRSYEVRLFSPYWLGYLLPLGLSGLVGVTAAFKLTLTLVLVAIPLATLRLVRQLGGDDWWTLLVFPLGFGFPTSWGFWSFLVAVPLVLLFLAAAFRYAALPTPMAGARVALFAALLFAAHAIATVLALVLFAAVVLPAAPGVKRGLLRCWPAVPAVLLLAAWSGSRSDARQQGRHLYLLGLDRITDLPIALTGIPQRGLAWIAVLALASGLALAGSRWSRDRRRFVPLAIVSAIVLLGPNMALGTAYIAPRHVIFLLPLALVALERSEPPRSVRGRRFLLFGTAALLLAVVQVRYAGMDREGEGLAEILEAAPSGERLLYLDYDRGSRWSPDPVFLHSASRYVVEQCGSVAGSFLEQYEQMPVRRREVIPSRLPRQIESMPQTFKWEKHGGADYGLYLVRTQGEPDALRIAGGEGRLQLLAHRGRWWLYENVAADG